MANEFIIKRGYISQGDSSITGSLVVTGGVTGSLQGTASYATTALSASYVSGTLASPGSTTQVVFNNAGVLGANNGFVYSGSNVGIGTTSPISPLHVQGIGVFRRTGIATPHSDTDLFVADSTAAVSTSQVQILGGNSGSSNLYFSDTDSYNIGGFQYLHSTNTLNVNVNAGIAMNIDSSRNVSIGATTPQARLDVRAQGALSTDIAFRVRNSVDTANLISVDGVGDVIIPYRLRFGTSFGNSIYPTNGVTQGNLTTGQYVGLTFAGASTAGYGCTIFSANASSRTNTSGTAGILHLQNGFSPTSGTGEFVALLYSGPINQTGGANGTTRGILLNPTLTSASNYTGIQANTGTANTVYIGRNTTSAAVQIDSTTQGFLPPRMTTTQRNAISAPPAGLMVYDISTSTEGLYYYNSGSYQGWTRLLNNSGSQSITGSLIVTEGITGSLFGTSSWAENVISSSYTLTASYALNGGGGPSTPTFPYTGSAIISGSLEITGSFSVNNGTSSKLDTSISQLLDDTSINSVDWQNRFLLDSVGNGSIEWNNRTLLDSTGIYSIDYSGNNGLNITNYRSTLEPLAAVVQEDFTQNAVGLYGIATNIAGNVIEVDLNIDLAVTASDLTFLDTDGIWKRTNQTTDTSTKLLGICVEPYNKGAILMEGTITVTTSSGYTDIPLVSGTSFYGMPVYFTGSTATFTTDKPTSGYVRVAGHMHYNSTTNPDYWIMKFNPSNDWYQI
jgi:hypothetical protein